MNDKLKKGDEPGYRNAPESIDPNKPETLYAAAELYIKSINESAKIDGFFLPDVLKGLGQKISARIEEQLIRDGIRNKTSQLYSELEMESDRPEDTYSQILALFPNAKSEINKYNGFPEKAAKKDIFGGLALMLSSIGLVLSSIVNKNFINTVGLIIGAGLGGFGVIKQAFENTKEHFRKIYPEKEFPQDLSNVFELLIKLAEIQELLDKNINDNSEESRINARNLQTQGQICILFITEIINGKPPMFEIEGKEVDGKKERIVMEWARLRGC